MICFLSQVRNDVDGSDTEPDISIQTVSMKFEADNTPIDDESTLGPRGLELCKGHTAYQMRRYENVESTECKMAAVDLSALSTVEIETKKFDLIQR